MKFKCELDQIRTLKKGMKITLSIDEVETANVMKNIYNFMDKSITVDLLVDTDKELEKMNWITNKQRKKIFALLNDISDHTGENREQLREKVSQSFIQATEYEEFSLSNCDKKLAQDFIEYLLRLAFELGVELSENPIEGLEDIEGYLTICIEKEICCVCGKPNADIHHVDAIGAGRDRTQVDDTEYRKMALCREHHTEYHKIGVGNFTEKYHVYGI